MSSNEMRVLANASEELMSYADMAGTATRNAVLNLLESMAESGIDPTSERGAAMLRDAAVKAIREATLEVREPVVMASADFFDALNGTFVASKADWAWASHQESVMANAVSYVDSQREKLVKGDISVAQFVQRSYDCGNTQVHRMHCNTLDASARKSGRYNKKARWARVPVGDTCNFCVMLASRGFVYMSAATAGSHYHANCDCRITNRDVKGYNPKDLESQWRASVTEQILKDGYRGTSKKIIQKVKAESPRAYEQWQEYCSSPRQVAKGAQKVHVFGTNEYFQAVESRPSAPSYFSLGENDVYRLVERSLGYGYPEVDIETGEWTGFYYFTAKQAVGVNASSGAFTRTFKVNCLSDSRIHAYPTYDRRFEPDEA